MYNFLAANLIFKQHRHIKTKTVFNLLTHSLLFSFTNKSEGLISASIFEST